MGLIQRIRSALIGKTPAQPRRFMNVRESDIPDEQERMLYEAVLNQAMRGGEVMAVMGPDGLIINDHQYASIEEAHQAEKDRHDG